MLVEGGRTVQINTTVMRRNVEELADVAALLADWGAHIWEGFFLIRGGRGSRREERPPPRSGRRGEPGSSRAQSVGTRDGKGILFVSHDGDVYPAGFLPYRLGNVKDDDIVRLCREHPLLRSIRATEFRGRCGVCEYADPCGGSRARAFATFGDAPAEDPAFGFPPAPRAPARPPS